MRAFLVLLFLLFGSLFSSENAIAAERSEGQRSDSNYWQFFESDLRPTMKNGIDTIVFQKLRDRKLSPAPLCSDSVFVRRVYYDLTGFPPSFSEAYHFLKDTDHNKRSKLIDRLLDTKEFVDYRTMKWADLLRVKSEFPINLWPNGAMAYFRWIHDAVRTNLPWDEFARTLLLADGSNFRSGPSNFYRALAPRTPEATADAVTRLFLATRFASLPKNQQADLALIFSCIRIKKSAEWKEEIVYWDRTPMEKKSFVLPDGSSCEIAPNQDPREVFTDWLLRKENSRFSQAIANRLWFWFFGRGIVQEPDDFREGNPPAHPELLAYLGKELEAHHYDMNYLCRLILNSHIYQQSSIARDEYATAEKYFAVYPVRRHEAEILQDTFIKVFNIRVTYKSEVPEPFTYVPEQIRTVMIADSGITNSFLDTFGRSSRDTGLLSDRNIGTSQAQQLFFLNSTELNSWTRQLIEQINKFIPKEKEKQKQTVKQIELLNIIWMTLLSRLPSSQEMVTIQRMFGNNREWSRNDVHDIIWAVVNTKEFLCQH